MSVGFIVGKCTLTRSYFVNICRNLFTFLFLRSVLQLFLYEFIAEKIVRKESNEMKRYERHVEILCFDRFRGEVCSHLDNNFEYWKKQMLHTLHFIYLLIDNNIINQYSTYFNSREHRVFRSFIQIEGTANSSKRTANYSRNSKSFSNEVVF